MTCIQRFRRYEYDGRTELPNSTYRVLYNVRRWKWICWWN